MEQPKIIDRITQVGKATLPPNSSLLLFGSRARGDARSGSDWDLLILLDKPHLSFNDYSVGYPFRELGWELDEEINPQVYSKDEWQSYKFSPFYKNVEHDKQVLL
ncbi:MAG: nucleotidyltransferase domain-containing protein [Bacteroidaceae bacterium]|nr:nucleotidyltransferase domain-containing protein [Bacteroidaceae bacterium]